MTIQYSPMYDRFGPNASCINNLNQFKGIYLLPNGKEEEIDYLKTLLNSLKSKNYSEYEHQEMEIVYPFFNFLIHCAQSKFAIYNEEKQKLDLSIPMGFNLENQIIREDRWLKEILIKICNCDSIENQLYRTITTSKFNVYETFYDFLLMDYSIFQLSKKVYDAEKQVYIDYKQNDFFISDSELRLKMELEAIRKEVSKRDRAKYFRNPNSTFYQFEEEEEYDWYMDAEKEERKLVLNYIPKKNMK